MTRLLFLALLALSTSLAHAKLRVAATTTFVGDFVAAIAGDAAEVATIFPPDADPHAYEPSPREIARLDSVRVIFLNGFGLEEGLAARLKNLTAEKIEVSQGIPPRKLDGHEHHQHDGHECAHGDDPHVWTDPVALQSWTTNIAAALARLDPPNAAAYAMRAGKLGTELAELDAWIRTQVATIPESRRVIVADHADLGWYAARYGFRVVGTVLPGFSTMAEPSARELAKLEKVIRAEKAPAIFSSGTVAPALAKRIASDTGAKLVELPGCSLGKTGSETATLPGYLRTLTTRIVEALK